MNDQTAPDVTNNERRIARDWAEHIESNTAIWAGTARVRAAARVILNDVPAPPRPTLADMTLDEQDECTGMQADLAQGDRVVILDGTPDAAGLVQVLEKSLDVYRPSPEDVTPRPDLPRLTWPGEATVPPNTLTEGSQWDDGDKLSRACDASGRDQIVVTESDGDVSAWNKSIDGWTPSWPTVGYEPFTIIHAGKEADQ